MRKRDITRFLCFMSSLSSLVILGSCNQEEFYEAKPDFTQINIVDNNSNNNDDDKTLCERENTDLICNPLTENKDDDNKEQDNDSGVQKSMLGLIGNVYEGQPNWNIIDTYFTSGYKHQKELYFSNFNVPERTFLDGFGGDDNYLKNEEGEKLVEWFAIKAHGFLRLPDNVEGDTFHIATVSDDGVEIIVDGNTIIRNPNTHSPTTDCANTFTRFTKGEEKKFELSYFQGPRFRIALMVLIKELKTGDFYFQGRGNGCYGNLQGLLNAGYQVIPPEWFTLPLSHR